MTKRNPVSTIQPIWIDAQEVSDADLVAEQAANDAKHASNVLNHIGTGILPNNLVSNILFDSDKSTGFLDGKIIATQSQPSDSNYGNQLEIELSDSKVAGNRAVKLAIIGLDFENNIQYETFIFRKNETQVSKKHFTQILLLLFNDLQGNPNLSLNLGGRLVIKESKSFYLSRDTLSLAQDIEPNLFFRDLFLDGFISLQALLQTALPYYDVDKLNIFTGEKNTLILQKNDVITQIGQKFQAQSNNIQKLTLLLSAKNNDLGAEDELDWNGDLVISIYSLQSTLECPSDIAPNLPIEFAPTSVPLAQVSVNYNNLKSQGFELNSVPQPVDFVFSNTLVGNGNNIIKGNYYCFSIKRSGSADKCDIQITAGSDRLTNSRVTTFTGTLWVDLPEEDLWFQIWSSAAKVTDGQAYENGQGIAIDKTIVDTETLATIDHCLDKLDVKGTAIYKAVVSAVQETLEPVADQRTGDLTDSRRKFVPQIKLMTDLELSTLQDVSDPLIIGSISDKNVKSINSSNALINSKLYSATFVGNELLIRIVDDTTDLVREDGAVSSLASSLLLGHLIGAKITPNIDHPDNFYRIADAKLSTMIVGDVNGDGVVDIDDLNLLLEYKDFDLNVSLTKNTVITTDGYTTSFTNGYLNLKNKFVSASALNFQIVNSATGQVLASGNDGTLTPNPNVDNAAQFTSASINFSLVSNLTNHKLVINNPSIQENCGGFTIVSINSNVLSIRKILLSQETFSQMFRADIDGDFHVTSNDGYLLQNYLEREQLSIIPPAPFPGPSSNSYNKIGKTFNVIKMTLENFISRHDDYSPTISGRSNAIHIQPDIFISDEVLGQSDLQQHNFYDEPISFSIEKQLVWKDELVITESNPRLVPSAFTDSTGYVDYQCEIIGVKDNYYPEPLTFDPGKNDLFIPNNLIINKGQLLNPDGSYHKIDFEVGTVVLEIPDSLYGTEQSVNIFTNYVADYTGEGITISGEKAMRFADCSLVSQDALINNQVRFSVSVQSFSPNINGLTSELYEGIIVDGKIGVSVDYNTGLLSLNFTNLFEDSVLKTLNTKIQIEVFLKKSGFNNTPLFVESDKLKNMLNLVSNYTGSGVNNLVVNIGSGGGGTFTPAGDLAGTSSSQTVVKIQGQPVSNVVPTLNQILQWNGSNWIPTTVSLGGSFTAAGDLSGTSSNQTVTGLQTRPVSNTAPTNGQVLTYNGSAWAPATPIVGGTVTNVQDGANYSNTFNIVGYNNNSTTSNNSFIVGSTFEFDRSSFKGVGSGSRVIRLKVIVETTAPQMSIRLFNVTAGTVVTGSGLSTSSTTPTVLVSGDLTSNLAVGSAIYQVQIKMDTGTSPDRVSLDYAGLELTWS